MQRSEVIRADRLKKLKDLRAAGVDPYPSNSNRTHVIGVVRGDFERLKDTEVIIGGRVRGIRVHGKVVFFDVTDATGKIQLFISEEAVGESAYDMATKLYDDGDFVEARGVPFVTKKGEKSIKVSNLRLLAKSLRPTPKEWFGLKDKEARFRQRYLDLLLNNNVRNAFELRSKIIQVIRRFLDNEGFLEVETPILQTLAGGALARPFKTHLNALDIDLFLRVAPELYLKRLLVGGFEKVYELGRNFRNEGMDAAHNPEFTMLEFYWAYQDREGLMTFTEQMLGSVVREVLGSLEHTVDGVSISFKTPWPRISFSTLLKKQTGIDYDHIGLKEFASKAVELGVAVEESFGKGKIADEIFKKHCRHLLVQPTFVVDHPIEISPLAKKNVKDPTTTERFQIVIKGNEYVNAFSELNDPLDQAERFNAQVEEKRRGDAETQPYDEDYIEAIEYGLPPAAGLGLGIDRFAALLSGMPTLRDIILFPLMRPK